METSDTFSEHEEALTVFDHAAQEIRFVRIQQWQVTNYALIAFAVLAAAPSWMRTLDDAAFIVCAGLIVVLAGLAWCILRSLDRSLEKERKRMNEARYKLPLIKTIHTRWSRFERDKISDALRAVTIFGAIIAVVISLARFPSMDGEVRFDRTRLVDRMETSIPGAVGAAASQSVAGEQHDPLHSGVRK